LICKSGVAAENNFLENKVLMFKIYYTEIFVSLLSACSCFSNPNPADVRFMDIGVPIHVSEARGVIAAGDADGKPIILSIAWGFCEGGSRSSLLIIDALTGATRQYYYPIDKTVNSSSYAFALSDKNFFYSMFGNYFVEFDVNNRKWTYGTKIDGDRTAMSFTIAPDGIIYTGMYPTCQLFSFNPKTKQLTYCGRLDPNEQYPCSLAADRSGWIYAGIGTARSNVVAFDPKTRRIVQILKESERRTGTGSVFTGVDGNVYAQSEAKGHWYRLFEGCVQPLEKAPEIARIPLRANNWGTVYLDFPDGRSILAFNLPEKWVNIQDKDKKSRHLQFDYEAEGAAITSLISGPDGKVYGSTCHPMHFFAYDHATNSLHDFGGLERVLGGTFADWEIRGNQLISAAYSSGLLYCYDLTKPWNAEKGNNPNPKCFGQFTSEIGNPQATLLHPDGHNVIFTGFPDYGYVGGGMVIYDFNTGQAAVIQNKDIIPGLSTIALKALPDGDLIAGTSWHETHGGHPIASEGLIYIMDWKTKKVTFSMVPVKGGPDVYDLIVDRHGLVHGLAGTSYFVFDPAQKKVINTQDVSDLGTFGSYYGVRVLCPSQDGSIYGLFKKAIIRIDTNTFKYEKICSLPSAIDASWVTGGIVLQGDRLYYSAGTNLYSYSLQGHQR
jgi:hypothetical protein